MRKYIILFCIFFIFNFLLGFYIINNPKNLLGYMLVVSSLFHFIIFLAVVHLYKEKTNLVISLYNEIDSVKDEYDDLEKSLEFLDQENQKLKEKNYSLEDSLLQKEEGGELDKEIEEYLPNIPEEINDQHNTGALK